MGLSERMTKGLANLSAIKEFSSKLSESFLQLVSFVVYHFVSKSDSSVIPIKIAA